LGLEPVVEPLLAVAAYAFVHGLRPLVVERRLPSEPRGAALSTGLSALLDERIGVAAAPAVWGHEQVVHHSQPAPIGGRPRPEQRREAHGASLVVARDELDALLLGVRDQLPRHVEQLVVAG